MARKPLLDATSKPRSVFGDFARSYRQSSNVEDKRAKQFRPTETGGDGASDWGRMGAADGGAYKSDGSTRSKVTQPKNEIDEIFGASGPTSDTTPKTRSDQTRKSSAEEAINTTFRSR